jgi:hypothetical protein
MENGGNAKVNAIFEARLAQSGKTKPTNLADGPTRERYIRDKYERRKYYDPAGFLGDYSSVAPPPAAGGTSAGLGGPRPGAPSEIARQRVASRQARMKPAQSNMYDSQPTQPAATKVAQAPVSAPVDFDLLDFSSDPTPAASAPPSGNSDPFLATLAPAPPAAVPTAQYTVPTAGSTSSLPAIPPPQSTTQNAVSSSSASSFAQEFMATPVPAPAAIKPTSNESIMALFAPPQQQQQTGYGMQAVAGVMPGGGNNTNMMMIGGMMPQQSNQHAQGMNAFGGAGMISGSVSNGNAAFMQNNTSSNNGMMQPQQQQQMMMQNMMMGGGNQMMMNPQMQQQMMMMQQTQQRGQVQMGMNMHNSMPGNMGNHPNNNFNSMMQGMQNMQVGQMAGINRQPSDDGGFGAPMGGSSQQQNDPFSSLGGMNAFR